MSRENPAQSYNLGSIRASTRFHDTNIEAARAERASPVVSTEPSNVAKTKQATKRRADGLPVMRFAYLMDHLGTLTRNTMRVSLHANHTFIQFTSPTPIQETAFRLLDLEPSRVQ